MGLMNRAEGALIKEGISNSEKKKTGLLDRVSYASLYDGLTQTFHDWLCSMNADRGGLLCSQGEGSWNLLCAAGLDLTTVNRFSPPDPFMSRIISEEKWESFSGEGLAPFRAFFSSRESECLLAIHVRFLGIFKDLRVCAVLVDSTLSLHRPQTFPRILKNNELGTLIQGVSNSVSVLSLLFPGVSADQGSIEEKTRSLLSSGMKTILLSMSLEKALGSKEQIATDPHTAEIYRAIVGRIKRKAGASNIVRICEDFTVKIVLFSSQSIDFNMYVRQLLAPLEKAFGIPRITGISVLSGGSTDSIQEIVKYVRGCA